MNNARNIVDQLLPGQKKLATAPLGKNGPQVTRLGYGTMGLSTMYGAVKSDDERFKVLDKLYRAGQLFWDTSDVYGDSEDLLGKWFKRNPGKREQVFLATKFALEMETDGSGFRTDSTAEYCRQACEKSLERLGVYSLDLYYCHRVDQKTPIEKTVLEMKKLKEEGKIKYLGLSEVSSETLRRACKVEPISAVQVEYSPFSLDIESERIGLLKTARELGIAIVAYSPIGRGMLGGQIRSPDDLDASDMRRYAPRFSAGNFPKNLVLVDLITEIAKKRHCTPSQLTLAWILAQGNDFFPIPGTTSVDRVAENGGSLEVVLTGEDEAEIRKACQEAETAGDRYPESFSSGLYADTPLL